jgi:hypothetical protein
MDRFMMEQRATSLEEHIRNRQKMLATTLLPFKVLPEVVKWKTEAEQPSYRKKTLVLEGPSGTNKTQYALSLYGVEYTMELNMADTDNFCLRGFRPMHHKAILWDEASPHLISKQRKLFQCPPTLVTLGQSSTGMLVYSVWVNDCVMIVCSNKWTSILEKMDPQDRDWVKANTTHIKVPESLIER